MLQTTIVRSKTDLEEIQQLQQKNLVGVLSKEELQQEGFVTLVHSPETLEKLHALAPSVIAMDGEVLAGYALVMPIQARQFVPALEPMFQLLDNLTYQNRLIREYKYYVMGQVCIAKSYRGKGLFDNLYQKHKELFQHEYDFVVTEIATRNLRSIRAHQRVGFKTIHTHKDELDEWAVVLWNWTQNSQEE